MIKSFTTTKVSKLNQWRKLVCKHRLHFASGPSGILVICSNEEHPVHAMAMAFDPNSIPIGVAIIADHIWDCNIMVYVKAAYRRRGIGTSLIKSVKRRHQSVTQYDCYCKNYRYRFYKKAGIVV